MCVYKYVLSTPFMGEEGGGWEVKMYGKSGADRGVYVRGAPCIGEGSGDSLGSASDPGQRAAVGGGVGGLEGEVPRKALAGS